MKKLFILGLFALALVSCNKENQKVTEKSDTVVVLHDSVVIDTVVGVKEEIILVK